MSDYLPFEIQAEIIRKLPVRSLVRCRYVCKSWKSLIDTSDFIIAYNSSTRQNTEVEHLLLYYFDYLINEPIYHLMVDDDLTVKTPLNLPPAFKMLQLPRLVGTSHGLLCLRGYYQPDRKQMVVLWNVTIKKSVAVAVPNCSSSTVYGFGICRNTADPKIVTINHDTYNNVERISWEVQVFALSTGAWRNSFSSSNLPRLSMHVYVDQADIDGVIYWLAKDGTDGVFTNLIISFDLTSEEFREVNLPASLAHVHPRKYLSISKLRESLVVLKHLYYENNVVVWMMENGDPISFVKLFDISVLNLRIISVFGFRKSGEAVIQLQGHNGKELIYFYEPHSQHINSLENIASLAAKIRLHDSLAAYSYMETLFLFDQPGFIIYDNGRRYNSKQDWIGTRVESQGLGHKSLGYLGLTVGFICLFYCYRRTYLR